MENDDITIVLNLSRVRHSFDEPHVMEAFSAFFDSFAMLDKARQHDLITDDHVKNARDKALAVFAQLCVDHLYANTFTDLKF